MTVPEKEGNGVVVGSSGGVCTWMGFEEGGYRSSLAGGGNGDAVREEEPRHLCRIFGVT